MLWIVGFCGCPSIGDSVCDVYALCTHLYSTCRWILIFTMLTVAAADEAPSDIIPHDYTQMLMAANSCKCL